LDIVASASVVCARATAAESPNVEGRESQCAAAQLFLGQSLSWVLKRPPADLKTGTSRVQELRFNILLRVCPSAELTDNHNRNAEHNRHIGDVEHSCSQRSNPDIQEIDNAATNGTVEPVRHPARNEQRQSERWPAASAKTNRDRSQAEQDKACRNREEHGAGCGWQIGPETQESAGILGINKSH
jgi:hypothetical protein